MRRACEHCGQEFEPHVRGGHEKRFCSGRCRILSWARRRMSALTGDVVNDGRMESNRPVPGRTHFVRKDGSRLFRVPRQATVGYSASLSPNVIRKGVGRP